MSFASVFANFGKNKQGKPYQSESEALADMSDADFSAKLAKEQRGSDRSAAITNVRNNSSSLFGGSSSNNSGGTKSSTSLFGGDFGDLDGSFRNIIDVSKDMARFRLGLDKEQGTFNRGLREEEAQSNFGRNTKLKAQEIQGQYDLQNLIDKGQTTRLDKQLFSEEKRQKADFDQQNLFRANSAALAMRGLK